MKTNNYLAIISLFLILSCTSKKKDFEYYLKHPVKFAKQKVEYPNGDFTIYIPKHWTWKVENYEVENIILGIDAGSKPDKNQFIDIISIQKAKSYVANQGIKSEFEFYKKMVQENPTYGKIIESGTTTLYDKTSYFIITAPTETSRPGIEMIMVLTASELEGIFYYLTASISQTKDLETRKAMLIQCLKTFKH